MDAEMMLTSRNRRRLGLPAWGAVDRHRAAGFITIPRTALRPQGEPLTDANAHESVWRPLREEVPANIDR